MTYSKSIERIIIIKVSYGFGSINHVSQPEVDYKNDTCIASYVDQNRYQKVTFSFYEKKNGQFYEEIFCERSDLEKSYIYREVPFDYIKEAMLRAHYAEEDVKKRHLPIDSYYIQKDLSLKKVLENLEDDVDIESLGLQEPEDFDLQ